MRTNTLLITSLMLFGQAHAQCDKSYFTTKEYTWKKLTDGLASRMGTNLSKAKTIIQQTAAFVQGLYPKPKGGDGTWYGYYAGIAPENQFARPYNADLALYPYICVNNKETRSSGYSASAFISFNGLSDAGSWIQLNEKKVLAIRAFKKGENGILYFNFSQEYDNDMHEAWMFTQNDQLPFLLMTRRDYLNEMREDASRKLAKSDPPLKPYYQKCMGLIDDEMKKGDAYLNETAQVLPFETDFLGFPTGKKSNDPNMSYLVKGLNEGYFNRKLAPATPQYIVMVTRYSKKDIPGSGFNAFIRDPVMLNHLSAMLGK